MAATDTRRNGAGGQPPRLTLAAAACREVFHRCWHTALQRRTAPPHPAPESAAIGRSRRAPAPAGHKRGASLQALTLAALALPGMFGQARADADEEAGFQYSRYQEGTRDIYTLISSPDGSTNSVQKIPYRWNPIVADSEHGFARFRLNDRVRFAFNYLQDAWSGASPVFTRPASSTGNRPKISGGIVTGASPMVAGGNLYFDAHGNPLYASKVDVNTGQILKLTQDPRLQQTLANASPEVRSQGDFKLGYDWDNASVDLGGGLSIEPDYESRFGNLAGRFDFNRKLTSLNWGLSYTNSDTHARWDPSWGWIGTDFSYPGRFSTVSNGLRGVKLITGNRQDGALSLGLTQVLNKNAVLSAGFGYTVSSGFQANPYKAVTVFVLDPQWRQQQNLDPSAFPGVQAAFWTTTLERRPSWRNQFTWNASYLHYLEPLQAAAQIQYRFFHDDWGINAHTFEGEWRQSLGAGWTLTPRVRYYSQSAASFYAPYIFSSDPSQHYSDLPSRSFSSDQRLSAFGALSGGVTLAKQFARGLILELGYEYYRHAGGLKLGGGGEGSYADFSYYVANANLRVDLAQLARAGSVFDLGDGAPDHAAHRAHGGHAHAPAGVMFDHMLESAGQFMLGYRFMRNSWGGDLLRGDHPANLTLSQLQKFGCAGAAPGTSGAGVACNMTPAGMDMDMHMLDLMYAPTDWLNLMLMPQFMDMSMNMNMLGNMAMAMNSDNMRAYQFNGGVGDTGMYALFKLWERPGHRLHLTQGVSAPSGSVNQNNHAQKYLYPFDMQLGSGTWDYKPSLTYTGEAGAWSWGAQISGTQRLQDHNEQGYALGNIFQATAWGGYQLNRWLGASLRGLYSTQGTISGNYPPQLGFYAQHVMTDYSPRNYGGEFADLGLGLNVTIPGGTLAGHHISFEWLQPVHTHVNGYQLDRTGALAANWSFGF